MEMFYAYFRMVVLRDPEWLQGAINVLIRIFRRVRLMENVVKSKTMTYQPGAIHTGCQRRISVGEEKDKGPLTRRNCGSKSHAQTVGWS